MKQKTPHELVLQAIVRDYSYDPASGIVFRNGKPLQLRNRKVGVRPISVVVNSPDHTTMWCQCYAHHIAWYLTYDSWPITEIDHIDRNPINNKLSNLRLVTHAENCCNRGKQKRKIATSSRYKGVHYDKREKAWVALIHKDNIRTFLGRFSTELEAAQAYDTAAITMHGAFATLNFPLCGE